MWGSAELRRVEKAEKGKQRGLMIVLGILCLCGACLVSAHAYYNNRERYWIKVVDCKAVSIKNNRITFKSVAAAGTSDAGRITYIAGKKVISALDFMDKDVTVIPGQVFRMTIQYHEIRDVRKSGDKTTIYIDNIVHIAKGDHRSAL